MILEYRYIKISINSLEKCGSEHAYHSVYNNFGYKTTLNAMRPWSKFIGV